MKITVSITSKDVKDLIIRKLQNELPNVEISENNVSIMVRSKQNYQVKEWERGDIKADITYDSDIKRIDR